MTIEQFTFGLLLVTDAALAGDRRNRISTSASDK